jgi:hypothetical protein
LGQIRFARGLKDEFILELNEGFLKPLLISAKSRDLDVQIRENNVDIYESGRCVFNLTHLSRSGAYSARIHNKFLKGLAWSDQSEVRSDDYSSFPVNDSFLNQYIASIDQILKNAITTAKSEATVEGSLVQASHHPGSPLVFLDRQVQLHGASIRMDLIGLSSGTEPKIILTELKNGLNNDIQNLMDQISKYYKLIAPDGRLREDVFSSYSKVIKQKQKLGLISPELDMPDKCPCVESLIVLYDYNERSRLLDRLTQAAKEHTLPVWLVVLPKGQFVIPQMQDWRRLS